MGILHIYIPFQINQSFYLASPHTVSCPRSSPHIFKAILVQTGSCHTTGLNYKVQVTVIIIQNNSRCLRVILSQVTVVASMMSIILVVRSMLAVVLIVFLLIHDKKRPKQRVKPIS